MKELYLVKKKKKAIHQKSLVCKRFPVGEGSKFNIFNICFHWWWS